MRRVLAIVGVLATWCKGLPPVLREYYGCGANSQ